jgi:hypothetical protein
MALYEMPLERYSRKIDLHSSEIASFLAMTSWLYLSVRKWEEVETQAGRMLSY